MFRGAKTIVFDPHADYVNINQIRRDLYNKYFKDRVENDKELMKKILDYRKYLEKEWSNIDLPWGDFDPSFSNLLDEEKNKELTTENLFYRLLNFCSIKNHSLMFDSMQEPEDEELRLQLDSVVASIKQLDWKQDLPEGLAKRKLTIKFNVFPKLQKYEDKSHYFTMRLIEAIAGERFSEAQEGLVIDWLEKLTDQSISDRKLLVFLENRIKRLSDNPSQTPLKRIIARASRTLEALIQRGCTSLDISNFVSAFCAKSGTLSQISTAVFDLANLESNHARRALIYAIMDFTFDEYKSKRLDIGKGDHPVLFALEEARTLIPRPEGSGEMLAATRAARLAAQQIATEGRKMGLGLLVISQKPASVDPLTVSQANTLVLHRVINPDDQIYIRNVGESLSTEDLEALKAVKEGVAIVTGDALKTRMSTLVKVRNRYSEPGTDKPRPIEKFWADDS